jgi:hypothetical protein
MASSIDASTSGAGGVITTADNTGILNIQTAGTTAVTVNASQNVGIGTTSPVFASGGGLSIYNATAARIKLGDSTSGIGSLDGVELIYDDDAYLFNRENTALIFGTTNTERMRIDSSGNVMVGTTSNFGCLFAVSKAGSDLVAFKNTSVTSNAGNWAISLGAADNFILQNSNGAGVQVTWGATSWSSFSDERLKNVIGTYSDALSGVMELKPVKFTWKSDAGNKPQVGILAQSVQSVVPEAVEAVTMNEEDETKYLTVRYTELIPLLTAAIQEQQTIINDLKARVTALEAK